MKVLRQLEDVHTVIYGDFLGCGMSQALFLRRGSCSAVADSAAGDILSIVDAEMESSQSTADSFGRRFLLTDFAQINIDRWNPPTVFFHAVCVCLCIRFLFTVNFRFDKYAGD